MDTPLDVLGRAWTCLDAFGRVETQLDVFGRDFRSLPTKPLKTVFQKAFGFFRSFSVFSFKFL